MNFRKKKTLKDTKMPIRMYGYFKCICGRHWQSGRSWLSDEGKMLMQQCQKCRKHVFPYKQASYDFFGWKKCDNLLLNIFLIY